MRSWKRCQSDNTQNPLHLPLRKGEGHISIKTFIKNRQGQKLAVLAEENPEAKGLVFVMHGLGGFKEQPQMQTFAKAFYENGYTTVLFDTTCTLGESEGRYEDATFGNYYEDLEDVIAWASLQAWYQEPFCLIGHSLGSFCIALYAENFPKKVKGLAPISTVVSGRLMKDSPFFKQSAEEWKKTGWKITESTSKPGAIKRLPWSFVEDSLKFDLMPEIEKVTMPVFMAVGENDESTPFDEQKLLHDVLPARKELHVIKDVKHTFRSEKPLAELKGLLNKWIRSL